MRDKIELNIQYCVYISMILCAYTVTVYFRSVICTVLYARTA